MHTLTLQLPNNQAGPSEDLCSEEAISPGPYSPPVTTTLVLCGHTVSSVKELIRVKINHFPASQFYLDDFPDPAHYTVAEILV